MEREAKERRIQLEKQIREYLEDRELDSVRTPSGVSLTLGEPRTRYYYRKEDMDLAMDWLTESGAGSVIKETVHHATFSKVCEDLENSGTYTPEFIQQSEERTLHVRRPAK